MLHAEPLVNRDFQRYWHASQSLSQGFLFNAGYVAVPFSIDGVNVVPAPVVGRHRKMPGGGTGVAQTDSTFE